MNSAFRSLKTPNYRLWAAGALISNIGTWMQRTAQDWLVLTQLSHNNATSVGIVMSLQFGPQLLLLPVTGYVADHFDLRKVLLATQSAMGVLALGLGLLTVTGLVQLWHVYAFALLLGCISAFDAPARQSFVSELVSQSDLSNAVGLNSTSFNSARMIGPAIAGIMIAEVGTGWVFLINALSFIAVIGSLFFINTGALYRKKINNGERAKLTDGFAYVAKRPDIKAILAQNFLIGTFVLNFPIFISTMSVRVFHAGAREYGLLTSVMAVGSVVGALLSARRDRPHEGLLFGGATILGIGCFLAATMPNFWLFGASLAIIGICSQTLTTTANSTIQLSTDPAVRGRVLAILLAVTMGGTPLGAPMVGWIADRFGPRWALGFAAFSAFVAAAIGMAYLFRYRNLRIHLGWRNFRIRLDSERPLNLQERAQNEVLEEETA